MLVFGENFIRHVSKDLTDTGLTRLQERASGLSVEELVAIIVEINAYLPDDWRMTRSNNSFSICVVPGNNIKSFLIVGDSYKTNEGSIYHIARTIYMADWVLAAEKKGLFPGKSTSMLTQSVLAMIPEIRYPNLYFFCDYMDDCSSPLFARQYERMKHFSAKQPKCDTSKCQRCQGDIVHVARVNVDRVVEYHRIHPLAKSGLDSVHFKWAKWDSTGNVQIVPYPDSTYHGKDYWSLRPVSQLPPNESPEKLRKNYEDEVLQYLGNKRRKLESAHSPFEEEYKFLCHCINSGDNAKSQFLTNVLAFIVDLGFELDPAPGQFPHAIDQCDRYYDDESSTLFKAGVSFRIRERNGALQCALKIPLSRSGSVDGEWLERTEEDCPVGSHFRDIDILNPQLLEGVGPYNALRRAFPEIDNLSHQVTVHTRRYVFLIKNGAQKAELCCDTTQFVSKDGSKSEPYMEIELESKGYARDELRTLANGLRSYDGLTPSTASKFRRGLTWLGLTHKRHE